MILLHITITLVLLPLFSATSLIPPDFNRTKSKRTLTDQISSNGDSRAVLFYMENPQTSEIPELQAAASSSGLRNFYSPPAKPLALVSVQQPIQVFEQDSPKQVAAQQVLYEFQQTPTNAESNVHVKQLFRPNVELTTRTPLYHHQSIELSTRTPLYHQQSIEQLPTTQPLSSIHPSTPIITANQHFVPPQPHASGLTSASSNHPASSETVVSPVQHNLYTNHGLNSALFNYYNPLLPASQQYQNTHISPKQTPGKYIYLNGKIVYHPNHIAQSQVLQNFPQNSFNHNKPSFSNQQKLPLYNHENRKNHPNTQPGHHIGRPTNRLLSQGKLPPITQNRFQAPKQLHPIDKPSSSPQQLQETEDDEKPVHEENSEEAEEENDEEERDEKEDDEEDNNEYEEEDDDDDHYIYERDPFEDDEFLDEEDNHYYRPSRLRKNKDRNRYRTEPEDDDEDDQDGAKRSNSKQKTKYSKKSRKYRMPAKYNPSDSFGYREKYSSNMKYQSPTYDKNGKKVKPKGHFKKVKYIQKPGDKPKIETIEGKFSEVIPVTHKHKVYKERWYVSKDIEEPNKKARIVKYV